MRFRVKLSASLAAAVIVVLSAGMLASAQAPSQPPSNPSPSPAPGPTSSPAPSPAAGQSSSTAQAPATSTTEPNSSYIAIDPLAHIKYDNRYDLSVGLAYDHMKAGPTLLQGSNLGGVDVSGSYWLARHWAIEGSGRAYLGTSGAGTGDNVATQLISGPFVAQYFFTAGPEWLGPHNKHGALIAHVLVGGVYGDFERDLRGLGAGAVGFYNNQVGPAMIVGGHIDLNRSSQWVFRMTPDAMFTNYGINYGPKTKQIDVNFALSVGVEYRFKKKR